DQGNELAAAKTLEELLGLDPAALENQMQQRRRKVTDVRARMHYFYSCHFEAKGDRAKQQEHLDKAVQDDPAELDALIARYALPDPDPAYHRETLQLIDKATELLRQLIQQFPNHPSPYNQLAWLVGNTEGDQDEALRRSRKAVDLSPESGAFLDTLAHVYFARGELDKAVETQTKAAQYLPHSVMIDRKLRVFQAALEQNSKKIAAPKGDAAHPKPEGI
ncbi:MAG: hypothetical protein ACYTG0_09130, partial [Planctomycetota bacterium]